VAGQGGPSKGDHFRFGSVFIKKINQTKTDSNRLILVELGSVFLEQKPVQTSFGSVFFRFGSVFFWFFSIWVQFGFFSFRLIKPKPNRSVFLKF